ncbi:MAG: hypothetical protein R2709_10710 [Marmoricola sp.]
MSTYSDDLRRQRSDRKTRATREVLDLERNEPDQLAALIRAWGAAGGVLEAAGGAQGAELRALRIAGVIHWASLIWPWAPYISKGRCRSCALTGLEHEVGHQHPLAVEIG